MSLGQVRRRPGAAFLAGLLLEQGLSVCHGTLHACIVQTPAPQLEVVSRAHQGGPEAAKAAVEAAGLPRGRWQGAVDKAVHAAAAAAAAAASVAAGAGAESVVEGGSPDPAAAATGAVGAGADGAAAMASPAGAAPEGEQEQQADGGCRRCGGQQWVCRCCWVAVGAGVVRGVGGLTDTRSPTNAQMLTRTRALHMRAAAPGSKEPNAPRRKVRTAKRRGGALWVTALARQRLQLQQCSGEPGSLPCADAPGLAYHYATEGLALQQVGG